MMLKLLLSIFVLTTTVRSQAKYCCYPDQWEATEGLLSGSSDDEGNSAITQGLIDVSYDAKGKRIHAVETIYTGNNAKKYTVLQLYDQSVQYVIQNTTCTRSKLTPWNNQNCIPDNATVQSQYRLGQNESIMVIDYSFYIGSVHTVATVTSDTCVPVVQKQVGQMQGVNYLLAVGLEGVTPGIKDPTVFNVPESCKGDHVVEVKRAKRSLPFTR